MELCMWRRSTGSGSDQLCSSITIPPLMLRGRYDFFFPVETSQAPMFRLLGTPKEHRRHAIFETSHVIPRNDAIRETLAWFDRYLGPVKRKEQ